MSDKTLSYNPSGRAPGWPSFYSFIPDYMKGMNGYFYTFKEGNLYRHNTNSTRNNYYGVQYISSIKSVFNPEPTLTIKLFKTMSYESDHSWAVTNLNTDLNTGSMLETYFQQKEGEWFSYIRSQASTVDWKLRSANGLGTCTSVAGAVNARLITFANPIGNIVNIGDEVYVATTQGGSPPSTTAPQLSGPITAKTSKTITVDASAVGATSPLTGNVVLYYKNSIAESNGARGYYMEFTMTNDDTEAVELFSVGSSIMKSYP